MKLFFSLTYFLFIDSKGGFTFIVFVSRSSSVISVFVAGIAFFLLSTWLIFFSWFIYNYFSEIQPFEVPAPRRPELKFLTLISIENKTICCFYLVNMLFYGIFWILFDLFYISFIYCEPTIWCRFQSSVNSFHSNI